MRKAPEKGQTNTKPRRFGEHARSAPRGWSCRFRGIVLDMPAVLITQCLQRDFVAPIEAHAPMPNALHVGEEESRRLLGDDPEHGPFAHLMHWARREPSRLHVVHIVDRHDPEDPKQAAHLETFGRHCIRGTTGASLVLDLESTLASNEVVVDAVGLNDFEETALADVLARIAATAPEEPMRVGVVGVWTDAKVTFLLYDLATRLGIRELATSSALTASPSRAAHFSALDQLRRLLGVRVFDGVGDLASFLVPDGRPVEPVKLPRGSLPTLECEDPSRLPTGEDAELIGYLHRQTARVRLDPLSGGFSGAAVYRAEAYDVLGHALAPSVVKVGPRALIATERVAFERVEPILGNHAPTLRGFADLGDRAAIRYAFASMGAGAVRTFKSLYERGADEAVVESVLRDVFETVLGRFQAAARYEALPLLDYYQFAPRWASNVRARVAAIASIAEDAGEVPTALGPRPHVALFYEGLASLPRPAGESHYVAYVHGDLNGANVLVDGRDNVWVIDFFHAHRGHVLRDLAKLESDLLYLMTSIDDDALPQAIALTDALVAVSDLRAPLGPSPAAVTHPALVRAHRTIAVLRSIGAAVVREDRDPLQLQIALLRYAVHTLGFDEASDVQKRWALATACGLGERVRRGLERNRGLRVDRVATPEVPGRLGITICPGRRDKGRSLDEDVRSLLAGGTTRFVSFVTEDELDWAGVPELLPAMRAAGLRAEAFAIPDQRTPTQREAEPLVASLAASLAAGESVVLACMGGLGRSGMIAACVLRALGLSADDAIARIREARGPRAIETTLQEAFVSEYRPPV